jgi:hypothetical protein
MSKLSKPSLCASDSLSAISPGLLEILSSNPEQQQKLENLDLGNLWQWILCLCVVNFDLELGHGNQTIDLELENSFPPIPFSEQERKTLCFSAFPDSNSAEHSGDTVYSFRMRNGDFTQKLYLRKTQQWTETQQTEFDLANSNGLPIDNDGFTYGHVFFRQQRDLDIKRGFFQKALVVLTPHIFPGLFRHLMRALGPRVMDKVVSNRKTGNTEIQQILESMCFEIASWPSPPSSWSFDIGFHEISIPVTFFGQSIPVLFPPHVNFPQLYELKQRSQTLLDFNLKKPILCSPPRFYQLFFQSLDSLWPCWELIMLGEPIVAISDTPSACSDLVLCLVELIKPVI